VLSMRAESCSPRQRRWHQRCCHPLPSPRLAALASVDLKGSAPVCVRTRRGGVGSRLRWWPRSALRLARDACVPNSGLTHSGASRVKRWGTRPVMAVKSPGPARKTDRMATNPQSKRRDNPRCRMHRTHCTHASAAPGTARGKPAGQGHADGLMKTPTWSSACRNRTEWCTARVPKIRRRQNKDKDQDVLEFGCAGAGPREWLKRGAVCAIKRASWQQRFCADWGARGPAKTNTRTARLPGVQDEKAQPSKCN
jgi:hypothetical protein